MPHLIVRNDNGVTEVPSVSALTKIGKNDKNEIIIKSLGVSREHAYIERQKDGTYVLFDGSFDKKRSTNGTHVGKERIETYRLTHNTTFRIVDHYLTFVDAGEAEYGNWRDIIPDETEPEDRTVFIDAETLSKAVAVSDETSERFSRFINAVIEIMSDLDERQLRKKALAAALKITEAARGILILKKADGAFSIKAKQGFEKDSSKLKISRRSVNRVMKEGCTLLICDNVSEDTSSIVKYDLNSVLCVPLKKEDKVMGCIYLDNRQNAASFTPDDLRILKILARQLTDAIDSARLRPKKEKKDLKDHLFEKEGIIVKSDNMVKLYQNVRKIARFKIPVLILGEPGTGKELIARSLHKFSGDSRKFVAINCAAINDQLFESELFGHVTGGFSGAVRDKAGFFEIAKDGTIFLDEIGELSPVLQAKLLRVLETREIYRVGSTEPVKINVRVVAATNKDLADTALRKEIDFRDDLYGRLEGTMLRIPPLRERAGDILPLTEFFLKKFAEENHCAKRVISKQLKKLLQQYSWPGNVRELQYVIQIASISANGKKILPDDLPPKILKTDEKVIHKKFRTLKDVEKQHISEILKLTNDKKVKAAELLGISRDTLRRKLKEYDLA